MVIDHGSREPASNFKTNFSGKVVIVTGGSSGIGRATALAFAASGAAVVVADIDEKGGNETVRRIRAERGDSFFIKTDVSKPEEVQNMVKKTIETYGHLDLAFNNAGIPGTS